MSEVHPRRTARQLPGLFAFCLVLGLLAVLLLSAGAWFLSRQAHLEGGLSLALAGLLAGAAIGLYHLRRWGVILFGLLSAAGSVYHLAQVFTRYTHLSAQDPAGAAAALFSILIALLIPVGLLYLVLLLWKQAG